MTAFKIEILDNMIMINLIAFIITITITNIINIISSTVIIMIP